MGYVIFQHFRKLSRGRVSKQTCSQSAVRGMSIHDIEERALSEQPRDKKIDMVDKKKKKRGKRLRNDKARSRTRVNIGSAFQRWRELKEQKQGRRFHMAEYGSCHTPAQSVAVKNYPNLSLL